ncbi:MAG: hypothetical protein ACR2O3_06325, partial [Rhizobiaceae bacterium]
GGHPDWNLEFRIILLNLMKYGAGDRRNRFNVLIWGEAVIDAYGLIPGAVYKADIENRAG